MVNVMRPAAAACSIMVHMYVCITFVYSYIYTETEAHMYSVYQCDVMPNKYTDNNGYLYIHTSNTLYMCMMYELI